MDKSKPKLRFDGSVWCNLDIALRNADQVFRRVVQPLGLTVIEWYILRALYQQDGQHASDLAQAVGRAATSFTPNLDRLTDKNLVERRADPQDRRAVCIYLTEEGQKIKDDVHAAAERIDSEMKKQFSPEEFNSFLNVLSTLQTEEFLF
ncbi:MAG: MarR family transcriptional regulator [Anaerolineae bacterium]|nr:MarR family transcriptional regulator [Anaerolineae bacterium]